MSQLIKRKLAVVLLGLLCTSAALAHHGASHGDLLDKLDLTASQRSEINEVLIGGMQSLDAVNQELQKLGSLPDVDETNPQVEEMRMALIEQRLRLAQSMATDILNVLSTEQLRKFDFGHLFEALPEDMVKNNTWEQEL
jgi:Spy/CpxP family protein refolding chaperone